MKRRTLIKALASLPLVAAAGKALSARPASGKQVARILSDGDWHHVVITRSAEELNYWVDGVRVAGPVEPAIRIEGGDVAFRLSDGCELREPMPPADFTAETWFKDDRAPRDIRLSSIDRYS